MDYRRTQFGGWPWPKDDPTHGREDVRFARHADGRTERADGVDDSLVVDEPARLVGG
jgi:hypothetical protein